MAKRKKDWGPWIVLAAALVGFLTELVKRLL